MKKTKIVCTIGPSSSSRERISAMINAGMNVARLNFSHGELNEHKERIELIKRVREEKHVPIAIMLDTKGPEFRIGKFENGPITLKEGDIFSFTSRNIIGDSSIVSVSFADIEKDLSVGDKILLNNGLMVFRVIEICGEDVKTKVETGGILSDKKSLFIPDKELSGITFLSEQDKKDLLFGIEQGVDFIALSFVSKAQDVLDAREFLEKNGGEHIDIIAKIENRAGVNNLKDIMQVCDGIMVARGDLGVEIPYEQVPDIQKYIINECRIYGKRVITATEMLESMIHNPRPTRAEISDVANAVYDGTSAVMLSGETAMGAFPVESVSAMAKIVKQAEAHIEYIQSIENYQIKNSAEALSHAACSLTKDLKAKAIVVCSRTGSTVRMVSRFRPQTPIIGLTTDEHAYRKLALSWGVLPALTEEYSSVDILFYFAKMEALKSGLVERGDSIVIIAGTPNGKSGNANLINVEIL